MSEYKAMSAWFQNIFFLLHERAYLKGFVHKFIKVHKGTRSIIKVIWKIFTYVLLS